jgi:biopolymer transport protein ExbB
MLDFRAPWFTKSANPDYTERCSHKLREHHSKISVICWEVTMRLRLLHGSQRATPNLLVVALFVVGLAAALTVLSGPFAMAAEAPPEDVELPGDDLAVPAAAAPAADAPASAPGGDKGGETPKIEQASYLMWMLGALGWFFSVVFLALSFTTVALFVMNLLTARRENVIPAGLIEGFEGHLNEKRYQEAYELAKADESFLGLVLSAGLEKLQTGYEQAIEAMQEVGEEENMKLEHRLSYLGLIGTIAPMIGLFGTVVGMVSSFQIIATSSGQPQPAELAGGISKALFTTF